MGYENFTKRMTEIKREVGEDEFIPAKIFREMGDVGDVIISMDNAARVLESRRHELDGNQLINLLWQASNLNAVAVKMLPARLEKPAE